MIETPCLAELVEIAVCSIHHGLEEGSPLLRQPDAVSETLRVTGASFVTLKQDGALRGCIGSLERHRILAEDVAKNAFAAAFRDPRFPALRRSELELTCAEVSVLSEPVTLEFDDEGDLLTQIRPGIDGLIVEHGGRRATYLPSVWELLPEPRSFVDQLLRKAGIDVGVSLTAMNVARYTAQYSNSVHLAR
jgi:uncharacterized protein